ncbi:MAG: transcription termination factor NusA [Desulfovibrionaceae bacterium]|nr:transcription termination factor NusA [Desulfovibrionaceae bacterium]
MSMELKKAIDQISKDRGIDRDLLVDTLEEAVRSSVARKYGDHLDFEVGYNEEQGEIEVYQFKVVAEEVEDPDAEITLEEARAIDPNVQIDDEMGFKLKIEDLGRIAAQSAKQVIIQRMRDAEQEIIYEEYKDRKGEIVSGIIQRRDRSGWIINLGRTEALLPKEEQIPRERYKRGDRVQAFIIEVLPQGRGPQIIVSRTHGDYMSALFSREVPEVADGTVRILGVSRDPGSRAKVAVMSKDRDVDPVGACVGIRGSRIQNIVQELRGERIDIVVWSPEIAGFARNALSPATVSRIIVDEEEKTLEVVVPDDQLNLAIGRKGQNVKLAAKLIGWKIDIFTESRFGELNASRKELEQLASVAEMPVENFLSAGFTSFEQMLEADDEALATIGGMTPTRMGNIRLALKLLAPTKAPTEAVADEGVGTAETPVAASEADSVAPEAQAGPEAAEADAGPAQDAPAHDVPTAEGEAPARSGE